MITIENPKDLLSVSLYNIFSYRIDDEAFIDLVRDWNKKILVNIEKFYPVLINFNGENINFEFRDIQQKPDLKVTMNLSTLLDIAYDRIGPTKAILTGNLKIKGIYKIGTLLKFKKIFLDTLKMVAADPTDKYYELNQNTK
ncbi:MAG: SCP2 sterol-binding domain-containing protein [Promethearchaeota archaeon]|nr:MAG: SCP2 sterol-binding domain-containing protein [Candidatus Lokiarchaeota archaeon]